jgi:hypothetical protein
MWHVSVKSETGASLLVATIDERPDGAYFAHVEVRPPSGFEADVLVRPGCQDSEGLVPTLIAALAAAYTREPGQGVLVPAAKLLRRRLEVK